MSVSPPLALPYLAAYPAALQDQVHSLLAQPQGARDWLLKRHPTPHALRTDKALFGYVDALKSSFLRKAGTLHKVVYDNKLHVVRNALGTHTRRSVVQGSRLNTRHEIRIAALFRQAPEAFLRMITVHELAHLRELEHDKAFYALCTHMEPDYHQYEFEVRLYLSHVEAGGARLWGESI
ncbi:M48 family metallopeptidase [Comamonas sp. GB3 AK4-5]|uniref:M48 metallopeptidase family protein n=1 Tax=Comamonas sp. GB3 AK4-5 TaxID=3231487 RepID=UPI00351F43A2